MGCRFEFRTQKLPYERILGNFSDFIDFGHQVRVCKKDHFSILAVIQKNMGFTLIWVADLNSERKNYPMKEFRAIFSISSILVIRSGYAKKDHISILAVIQKIWDLHKFGLQIWIQNAKITLWKNFGQFFRFHRFWLSGPGMQKRSFLNISCNSKKYGIYINLGCRFEFRTQKLPYETISGNFFDFIDFSHQVLVCKKISHLNISCNSKNMGLT